MGMFDEVLCKYDIGGYTGCTFQTKSMFNSLENFIITEDGRLIWDQRVQEGGTPPKDWSPAVDLKYHGVIELHEIIDSKFVSFNVVFVYGKVDTILNYNERIFLI